MAAEFKFPNEIDPLGSNLNRALDFQKMPPSRQKQITVRVGEILRGKIVEVVSPQVAVISLPDGNFTAEITGKFQPGDELFFRVQSVEPTLVLKIHSVFIGKDSKEFPTSEILRILDLPKSSLFEQIVARAKEKANIIVRDELIVQAKYANNLLGANPKENLNLILNFIDFSIENNIEPTSDLYSTYKKFLALNDILPKLWLSIASNFEFFPEEVKKKILAINSAIKQNVTYLNLLKLLSPNFSYNEENLFNILVKINKYDLPGDLNTILEEFRNWFNAFWIVNASSTMSLGSIIYFILPFIWENNPRFTILRYRRKKYSNVEEQKFTIEDEELLPPIRDSLERELGNFFSQGEWKNEFSSMLNQFRKQSRKEGNRLIVKTPLGYTQIIRLLTSPPDTPTSVSIVI